MFILVGIHFDGPKECTLARNVNKKNNKLSNYHIKIHHKFAIFIDSLSLVRHYFMVVIKCLQCIYSIFKMCLLFLSVYI